MNILADENCDRMIVAALRNAGHDVVRMADIQVGADDNEVRAHARALGRILLTGDLDFGSREGGSSSSGDRSHAARSAPPGGARRSYRRGPFVSY